MLYGENSFYMDRASKWPPVIDSWGPGQANLEPITVLSLTYVPWDTCAQDRKVLEIVDSLHGLREVSIHLHDV